MSGKHPKTDTPTDADLKGNPGIGTSKGMSGAEANAVGGGWEVEEPRCEWSKVARRSRCWQYPATRYMVLCAAGATQDVKSK